MTRTHTSKFGKIVKRCPGLNEYWRGGKLIARGASISVGEPRDKPTAQDWQYCQSLLEKNTQEESK